MKQPNTLLLFPGPGAVDISELTPVGDDVSYNLVLLDGTWGQAKNMFISNPILHLPKKVTLRCKCINSCKVLVKLFLLCMIVHCN